MYRILFIILVLIIIVLYNNKKESFLIYSNDAYVINLDSHPERIDKLVSKFPSLNIHRISAIKANPGILGCGLSHAKTVTMAKNMGLPSILILEDDCIPTAAFVHWPKVQNWLENHKEQWDIFLGGTTYYGLHDKHDSIKPICKIDTSIRLYKTNALTAHFYYIHSNAYDAFLEWEQNKDIAIDWWPNKKNMKVVSSIPFLAIQDSHYSDIMKREENYDELFNISEKTIGMIENITECFKNIT